MFFEDHKHLNEKSRKNWINDVKIDCSIDFRRHNNKKKSIKKSITSNSKVFLQRLIIRPLCDKKKNTISQTQYCFGPNKFSKNFRNFVDNYC